MQVQPEAADSNNQLNLKDPRVSNCSTDTLKDLPTTTDDQQNQKSAATEQILGGTKLPMVSSEVDFRDEESLTISQIPLKMDSSDEDGDDKSIQLVNEDEQTENELLLNRSIMRSSVVVGGGGVTETLPELVNKLENTMEEEVVAPVEVVEKRGAEVDDEEDDDIDVYEKQATSRKSSDIEEADIRLVNFIVFVNDALLNVVN